MRRWLDNPAVFLAVVICLGVLGTFAGVKLGGSGVTAEELQAKLIVACERGRAPLQVRFQFELDQSEAQSIKQIQELFPDFPPEQIRESIQAERMNLRHLLETYDPDDCADTYR